MKTIDFGAAARALGKNKYVLAVLVLGLVLLLLPRTAESASAGSGAGSPLEASGIPLDTESSRLAELLARIDGVGDAAVLLSERGAVVVCAGAESARVRLAVINAVSAYTGLGSDKITVMKMK